MSLCYVMPGLVLLLLLGCLSSNSANTSQPNPPKALRAGLRQDLADRLKISANDVSILHTAGATWRDTGLGCEEPDRGGTLQNLRVVIALPCRRKGSAIPTMRMRTSAGIAQGITLLCSVAMGSPSRSTRLTSPRSSG